MSEKKGRQLRLEDARETFGHLMEHLGLDEASDPHLGRTPERVAALWAELFGGLREPTPEMSVFECEYGSQEPVVIAGLPLYSMCAHHFLPFFGEVDIAYIPGARLGGVGSFSRVVAHFARRPQVQERLVEQVADHIERALEPKGVLVRVSARHLCMEMRGEKVNGRLVNTAARGILKDLQHRSEVFDLIKSAQRSR